MLQGFAFLQYRDPTCAVAAIEKFHHMKLDDGHVLKVRLMISIQGRAAI